MTNVKFLTIFEKKWLTNGGEVVIISLESVLFDTLFKKFSVGGS